MYNQGLLPGTTTFGKIAGTCILCTAIGVTPVESVSFKDYTKRSSFEQVLTTTSWENKDVIENIGERVAVVENDILHIKNDINSIPSVLEKVHIDVDNKLIDIKNSIEKLSSVPVSIGKLEESMTWVKRGIIGIFITTLIGLIKYLFFCRLNKS